VTKLTNISAKSSPPAQFSSISAHIVALQLVWLHLRRPSWPLPTVAGIGRLNKIQHVNTSFVPLSSLSDLTYYPKVQGKVAKKHDSLPR